MLQRPPLSGAAEHVVEQNRMHPYMGMTITEKILARASDREHVRPGENVWVQADVLMTHDVCGPGTIGIFRREFGPDAHVWDREKVVLTPQEETDELSIDLYGDLAGILGIAAHDASNEDNLMRKRPEMKNRRGCVIANDNHNAGRSVKLVAGGGFEPPTFGL